jgi:hypothetical protein
MRVAMLARVAAGGPTPRIGDDLERSLADDFHDAPDDFTPYT